MSAKSNKRRADFTQYLLKAQQEIQMKKLIKLYKKLIIKEIKRKASKGEYQLRRVHYRTSYQTTKKEDAFASLITKGTHKKYLEKKGFLVLLKDNEVTIYWDREDVMLEVQTND